MNASGLRGTVPEPATLALTGIAVIGTVPPIGAIARSSKVDEASRP